MYVFNLNFGQQCLIQKKLEKPASVTFSQPYFYFLLQIMPNNVQFVLLRFLLHHGRFHSTLIQTK